jgi:predicted permease
MERFGRELRHAARRLGRSPSFTVTAILTLALAIGANASIFAVVQRVVLNPLPYPDSDRLIQLDHARNVGMSAELYKHYAARARTLDSVAIWDSTEVALTGSGDAERVRIVRVTPSLATVLRIAPAYGRWFNAVEPLAGSAPAAVISNGLWMRRYGGDAAVIGRSVTLNGISMEIIGVMPAGFTYPEPLIEAWIVDERLDRFDGLALFTHRGVARLRDGVSLSEARAELTGLLNDLPAAYPESQRVANLARSSAPSAAIPLKDATIGTIAGTLWILLASVGVVLLIACANVANLFLVRSEARQTEVALRRVLGAGWTGIARYFAAESLLLSVAGALAGLGLAWIAVQFVVAEGPATLPRLDEIRLDGYTVAFTGAVALATGVLLGAVPALRQRLDSTAIQGAWRGTAGGSSFRTRHLLMGTQIAFALMLLTASGLMVRSFQNLRAVDPGFDPASTLTFRLGLPPARYPDHDRLVGAHRAILERLSAVPGVTSVSASNCLPLENERCVSSSLRVQGRVVAERQTAPGVSIHGVAAGYFDAMGMRVVRGRGIDRDDVDRRRLVVVVNEALAAAYFPDEDPIGQRVTTGSDNRVWGTIVGVVSNTPTAALNERSRMPKLYSPMSSTDATRLGGPNPSNVTYVVRGGTAPLALLPFVRAAVNAVDRDAAMAQPRSLQEILDRASAQMAFTMVLIAIAAAVAVALGVVGIYGAMSYIVSQRTGEIGIRVAMGARPGRVGGMIVRQGGAIVAAGMVAGSAAAMASGRVIESLLYGVGPHDPAVLTATMLLLLGVTMAACWLPARRAARLDPVEALRVNR